MEGLGARIRIERTRRGLSTRGLGSKAGISPSFISSTERGLSAPSITTLEAIGDALGMSIADLIREPPDDRGEILQSTNVQKRRRRRSAQLAQGWQWPTAASGSDSNFVVVVHPPGSATHQGTHLHRHSGREFSYVISGTLAVTIGFEDYLVETHHSITFDAQLPHQVRAEGDEPTIAVWAVLHGHNP